MDKECAIALREELGIIGKIDFSQISQELSVSIREVDSQGFDGALVRSSTGTKGIIYVKRSMKEEGRKRFTIAHEIGHFILHADKKLSCSSSDIEGWTEDQENPERQADSFASELLLPSREVRERIGTQWPSFQVIENIAASFGASLTATARKYCDVTPHNCAIVWSVEGKIRWMYPAPRFSYWVPVGQALGSDSFAAKVFEGVAAPKEMQEVAADEWISSYWLLEDAVVWEQSIAMPNYKGCLSLLWVRREIEKRPSEADELLSELDPDEFTHRRKKWPR
jgi:hypothetical protein